MNKQMLRRRGLLSMAVLLSAGTVFGQISVQMNNAVYAKSSDGTVTQEEKDAAIAAAQAKVNEYEKVVEKAQDVYQARCKEYEAASTLLDEMRTLIDTEPEQVIAQIGEELAAKKAELEKLLNQLSPREQLEANLAAAKAVYNQGSKGFFQYLTDQGDVSAAEAIAIFDEGYGLDGLPLDIYEITNLGASNDATNLDNMRLTFDMIREGNRLRTTDDIFPGRNELLVNSAMMAVAQIQLNWSKSHIAHSYFYLVSENLAWGYSNPFKGWYTEEKENYITENGKETGHYLNLMDEEWTVTGFAYLAGAGIIYGYPTCHGQVFTGDDEIWRHSAGAESVDTYEQKFLTYYNKVKADIKEAEEALENFDSTKYEAQDPENSEQIALLKQEISDLEAKLETAVKDRDDLQDCVSTGREPVNNQFGDLFKNWISQHSVVTAAHDAMTAARNAMIQADNELLNARKELEAAKNLKVAGSGPEKAEGKSMFRLYNPNSSEHFYTSDEGEKNYLVSLGWKDEGIGWTAPVTSDTPVYRLYNPNAGDHHYTTNANERDSLKTAGWKDEGIGWYSESNDGQEVYRLYNPNATGAGAHHYTVSYNEYVTLESRGWKQEGIGWYGMK